MAETRATGEAARLEESYAAAEQLGRLAEAEDHYRGAAALTTAAWGADDPLSQHCQQTLEAFLAAPAQDPPASPPSDPTESSA